MQKLEHYFSRICIWTNYQASRAHTSIACVLFIIVWIVYGYLRIAGFDNDYLAWAGAFTGFFSIIMLFIILNATYRESKEIRILLNEILLAIPKAANETILLKDLTEEELCKKEAEEITRASANKRKAAKTSKFEK